MTDELRLIQDCLPEQAPPTTDAVAAARTRLAEATHAPARHTVRRRAGGPRAARPRGVPLAAMRPARRTLLLRGGLPTAGVVLAAAVAVTVSATLPATPLAPALAAGGGHSGGHGGGPGAAYAPYAGGAPTANGGGTTGSRAVLLAAATKVGQAAEPASERYWVTTGTVGTFVQVGPSSDRYMLLEESGVENWAARSPKDASPQDAQPLGAVPVSAADRAAWRRDGSPTKWAYSGQSDALADPQGDNSGFLYALIGGAGPITSLGAGYGAQQFDVGAKTLTLAQLRALPADPAKLEKLIVAGGVAAGESTSAYLLQTVPAIMEMPVTSAVRAALYRMLADLPGTENLGQVKDPAGQQGEAVGYTASYQDCTVDAPTPGIPDGPASMSCTVQQILIIDPVTGLPMAEDLRYTTPPGGQQWTAPDGLFSYEIFGQSYWTNQNPPKPANPPQVSMQPMIQPKSTLSPTPGKDCVTLINMHGKVTFECPKAAPSHPKSSGSGARR
jgi:hypothetical protein